MCCYRDRTVSAISYEHLGSYIFFSALCTPSMPVFYFCHYFLFSQLLLLCQHTKDTNTSLGLGKSKPSRLDSITIGIVKAISFLFF